MGKMSKKVYRTALEWFGHVVRISVEPLSRCVHKSEVKGRKDRDRLCMRWMHKVKKRVMKVNVVERCEDELPGKKAAERLCEGYRLREAYYGRKQS